VRQSNEHDAQILSTVQRQHSESQSLLRIRERPANKGPTVFVCIAVAAKAVYESVLGEALRRARRRLRRGREYQAMQRQPIEIARGTMLLGALLLVGSFAVPSQMLGQSSEFAAPGRSEGTGPPLSIGVAATGIVGDILVQEGSRVQAGQLLLKLDCQPQEADVRTREAHLAAAQATYDKFRNGARPDEIAVGEAVVGYSQARAEEAHKTLQRTLALQEGVSVTVARVLEVQRDDRIAAAQLAEARSQLDLLRAGSRDEDIRQAKALRDAAAADLDASRARLNQCSVHAPVAGVVLDVLVNQGQFLSLAVPQPLLHIVPDGQARVRAEVALQDLAHVCLQQRATIAADAFPNAAIEAQVEWISPELSRQKNENASPSANAGASDVVPVVLKVDRGAPVLPIGLPVSVHFQACPSKS
jgi:HlyD family secretion protein